MRTRRLFFFLAITVPAFAFAACSGSEGADIDAGEDETGADASGLDVTVSMPCIPGQQLACACPGGGSGAQTCNSDGRGFGTCNGCGDASFGDVANLDAAGDSDADASTAGDATGDAGVGDAEGDAGSADASSDAGGNCSPALGPECDLVLQNCAGGKECVVAAGPGGTATTTCGIPGTGTRPRGSTCCPGQVNQCSPGLECIGPDCSDGGAPTARCTPHCCLGDDSVCGQSVPEGFAGSCNLTIVEDFPDAAQVPVFQVCIYKGLCEPFHVQACPTNYTCLLQGDGVSFRCDQIFSPPGAAQGAICTFGNECADGLECLGPADGGASKCTTTCYHPDASAPFDAGVLTDAATFGGCSAGKSCSGAFVGAPAWLGFCAP